MKRIITFLLAIVLFTTIGYAQSFLSVSDILSIRKGLMAETTSWALILKNKGYNKTMTYEGDDYAYKNCRLVYVDSKPYHSDGEYFEADKKTADASYAHFYNGGFCVVVYTQVIAKKWIEQAKALGYRLDKTRGGTDRFGSNFYFIKRGNPEIRISEKSGRYMLDIDEKSY